MNRVLLKKILVGQMAIEGINTATINFFNLSFDLLYDGDATPEMMAAYSWLSANRVGIHLRRLQKSGYLEKGKQDHRWRLDRNPIRDRDFILLAKLAKVDFGQNYSEASRPITQPRPPVIHKPKNSLPSFMQRTQQVISTAFGLELTCWAMVA